MEPLTLFVIAILLGEIASNDVPQATWTYAPPALIEIAPERANAMCEDI